MRVGYAAQNGHPYVAIGRELIARGALTRETVSMQSIRAWLVANPGRGGRGDEPEPVLRLLPRRSTATARSAAQGVALTPGRSLAVDRAFFPMGLPVWLDAADPLDADRARAPPDGGAGHRRRDQGARARRRVLGPRAPRLPSARAACARAAATGCCCRAASRRASRRRADLSARGVPTLRCGRARRH